ncbi:hypothetical protein [Lysobacter antibioticus]|uniref:hypothetical protein n=1 Tax=Lysobacter antibioticus TaxID=84531 RepID=UPI00034BC03E|nr:hypothetical protein [Lysobacter antibioticus]
MGLKAGAILGVVLAACTASTAIAAPAAPQPVPAPLGSVAEVDGVAAAEWTARWWRWVYAFPAGREPYRDRSGAQCAQGQDADGPVWFLAGTDGRFDVKRRCRVPAGRHLLVPAINMYFHAPLRGENAMSCARVKAEAALNNQALVSAVVLLDGRPLARPVRLVSRCFDTFAASRDSLRERGGRVRAAADGYWLLLPPLAPGRHRLVVGANYGNDADPDFGRMIQNFEYELEIGEPAI